MRIHMGSGFYLLSPQCGAVLDVGPFETAYRGFELLIAARMLADEIHTKHAFALVSASCAIVRGDQRLAEADNRGEISAGTELVILRADRRFRQGKHLRGRLWISETFKATFPQWIECNDRCAALAYRL